MELETQAGILLQKAEAQLQKLSPERLRVAIDFLTYLAEREADEATQELLAIPGLEAAFREALKEAESGEVVSFDRIRRDV